MDLKQARKIVAKYREHFGNIAPVEGPYEKTPCEEETYRHAVSMLEKMDGFLDSAEASATVVVSAKAHPNWDKFNRWLGFLQGILWCNEDFTLNEMRDHNRAPTSTHPHGTGAMMPDEWMGKTPDEIAEIRKEK